MTMNNGNITKVSWPGTDGIRLFGRLIRWDGDYAIVKHGVAGKYTARIYVSNLTYECG